MSTTLIPVDVLSETVLGDEKLILGDENNQDTTKKTKKTVLIKVKKTKESKDTTINKAEHSKHTDLSIDADVDDDTITEAANDEELALKWGSKSQLEHIRDLPDTYIGSIEPEKTYIWTLEPLDTNASSDDDKQNDNQNTALSESKFRIINKEVEYVPGLRSIIEEILVNAFDNMNRVNQRNAVDGNSKRLKKVTYIKVTTNRETGEISIMNDGEGIDIAIHPKEQIYIPEMIFGKLLTSGNYNKAEKKITGGKNGYGAKLTNIFSTYFKVETIDRHRKLRYIQEYRNNMDVKGEPIIETNYRGETYTRITFIPDYKRLNTDIGLTETLEELIEKRTIDMFACSRGQLNVFFNDNPITLKSFSDYMKLYLEPDHLTVTCKPNDRWEIGACMTPSFTFQQVSFVNGINTHRGGKHVEYIVKQITKKMVDLIKRKKRVEVKESFIRDNLMVFINATIENPAFDSQTKETLSTLPSKFGSECTVPDAFVEKLSESGIMDRALALSEFRDSQMLKKTDGTKKRRILDIPKLDDANWAGSKKGDQCTLILTEGDSAKAMAIAGRSVIADGHNIYGVYPLKGKLMNIRDKEDVTVANNKEICEIKKILGLQEDFEYKDVSSLRYGRIMLMTDSDVDGSHIKGLIINFLSKWTSLMKITGFITSLLTPIVKAWKKGVKNGKLNAVSFYTLNAFNEWLDANNGGRGYEVKYYKGLGSSTPQEGKEYFKNFKLVTYHWDDEAAANIDLAFNKKRADDRKLWLKQYDENSILDINQSSVTFTDFINKDLIHFSESDNHRSIPNIFDGMKPSLRKIIYCSFKRGLTNEIKVAQLAGYVSEHGAYHHGEVSLTGAIINLAQNFVGTNNINLLMPEGQFGSRLNGGSDFAAPRYIHTYLSKITSILFNKDDSPLLKYNEDDGQLIEPTFYMTTLPVILINGTTGIGTGWSSDIPQFNPLDIVANLRNLMADKPIMPLNPWYRGFKGMIKRLAPNRWLSKGCYQIINNSTIEITELPIGCWTQNFKNMLDMYEFGYKPDASNDKSKTKKPKSAAGAAPVKIDSKKPKWTEYADTNGRIIKSYRSECSESIVKFTITFESDIMNRLLDGYDKNGINDFEKIFGLTTPITCENTKNLYDETNKLRNFKTVEDILQYYYERRIIYYELRRKNLIKILEGDLLLISTRARFILDVISDVIKVRNIPKSEVVKQLEKLKYPKMVKKILTDLDDIPSDEEDSHGSGYDFLVGMPIYSLTKEKVDELLKEKECKTIELDIIKKKTDKILWEEDLQLFEKEYKKHMDDFYDYMALDPKQFEGRPSRSINRTVTISKKPKKSDEE